MRGGAHLGIGTGSTMLGLYGLQALGAPLDPLTILFGAMAAGLGALAPDIDHPRSTASNSLPDKLFDQAIQTALPLLLLAVIFAIFGGKTVGASLMASFAPLLKIAGTLLGFAITFVIASMIARRYTTHRGATHSLLAAGIATLLALLVCAVFSWPAWYGLLFGWGWITHLGADATSKMGLPSLLLWPFGKSQPPAVVAVPASISVRERMPVAVSVAAPDVIEPSVPVCPRCGVTMVLRTAKRGAHQGNQFYGCTNYPSCRQTRPA